MKAKRVLLVCTGNLCRSPMAVGLLRHMLKQQGLDSQVEVTSAGTLALEGEPATPLAIYVMAERGIPISSHRSHRMMVEDMENADLVLVMTYGHKAALTSEVPQHQAKIYLLSELAGEMHDIEDPISTQEVERYAACTEEIQGYLGKGLPRLLELLGIDSGR